MEGQKLNEEELENQLKKRFGKEKLEESYNNDKLEEKKISRHVSPLRGVEDFFKMVVEIREKEFEAFDVLFDIVDHIHKTYNDKYQSDVTNWLDTKALLLSKDGKFANIHNAGKYIQRYSSVGFEKSGNIQDCIKAVHYIIFEIQRQKSINKEIQKREKDEK